MASLVRKGGASSATAVAKIRMKAVEGRTVGTNVWRITWPQGGCAMKAEIA